MAGPGMSAGSTVFNVHQVTAATDVFYFICPRAGVVNYVAGLCDIIAASGESMSIDVKIAGTSCLSSALVLDDSNTTEVAEAATVSGQEHHVSAGDCIKVEFTYAAGGGPTPILDTAVVVEVIH